MTKQLDIILAIVPRIMDDFGYTPAGAALLKGNLEKNGFSSKIIDFNAEIDKKYNQGNSSSIINRINNYFLFNNFYHYDTWLIISDLIDSWAKEIVRCNPKWLGISVFSYNSQRAARLLSMRVKFYNSKIKIVIGGSGIATDFTFAETLKEKKIVDHFIRGEGEISLIELLKGNANYPGIDGRAPKQIVDLDNLPFPNYDDYELKTYTNKKGLEALPITGSRGCVRKCTFCDVQHSWPNYYYRSGESIAQEIIHQCERHGVNAFRFTDSLINGSMKAFRDMCVKLSQYRMALPKEKRFIWDTHFIVRSEKQMPPSDFDLMRDAGAGTMLIGVESGSEAVRNHMKKGFTQADLDYTMAQFQRCGIKCRFLMIVGYPTETLEDFNTTLKMFEDYKIYLNSDTIEEVNLGLTLNLLPTTPLYKDREQYNIIQQKNHINEWICRDNPTLNYRERIRRRIILQSHLENLGYKIFEAKNYAKQLLTAWIEMNNLNIDYQVIDNWKYDREKGGLVDNTNYDIYRKY